MCLNLYNGVEQMMSGMGYWLYTHSKRGVNKVEIFANIIKIMAQACIEITSERLFDLFIGQVQGCLAGQPPEIRLDLQDLIQQEQERVALSIKRSKLQHQKTSMANIIAGKQKHQDEQLNKCAQLEQKIAQKVPVVGLVNVISAAIEDAGSSHKDKFV